MRKRERGAVLLLVLGVVAVLSILAVELASRANVGSMRAARTLRDASFRRLFDSGAEVARGLLSESKAEPWDSWGDSWNEEVSFRLLPEEAGVVRISDESGKINIARAISHPDEGARVRPMLVRLFEYLAGENPEGAARSEVLKRAVLGRLGLGSKDAKIPGPRPAPLLTLDGLRDAGLEASLVFGKDGLSRYLTCFGDGKINLNTAPKAVLYALGEDFDRRIVERIARYRGKGEGEKGADTPFREPKDLELVDGVVERTFLGGQPRITRNLYSLVSEWVTTQSSCFAARIQAHTGGDRRREAWVFFRVQRVTRSGEPFHREFQKLALEEILP